jgi:glycosyltransferase involved in cell wall biosynthesis
LAQSFEDWEVVLVDDASTDNSLAVARGFEDPRIHVHVNPSNLGTYGSEARGVLLSKGSLIAIMNSDDRWLPSKLGTEVEMLHRHPKMPLCYTLGEVIDESGQPFIEDLHSDWPREPVQDVLPQLLVENRVLASSVLFRRAFAQFDGSLQFSGDWVALLRGSHENPIGCVPAPLTLWRQHRTNTFRRSSGQVNEEIRVRKSIMANPQKWRASRLSEQAIDDALGRCALNLSALLVLTGDMSAARAFARSALQLMRDKRAAARRLAATLLPAVAARKRLWPGETQCYPVEPVTDLIQW